MSTEHSPLSSYPYGDFSDSFLLGLVNLDLPFASPNYEIDLVNISTLSSPHTVTLTLPVVPAGYVIFVVCYVCLFRVTI